MLNEGIYEQENEEENSINPGYNDDKLENIKYSNKKSTNASTFIEKEILKEEEKEEEKEDKNNKKEEFHEEKEVDQITELVEKYKSILMKISNEDSLNAIIYGLKSIYLKSKSKIKNGVIFCDDETYLQFICPDDSDNVIQFKIKLANISDIIIGRSNGYLKEMELPIEENSCITIKYNDGFKHIDLIFNRNELCEIFISGLIFLLRKRVNEGLTYDSDLISLKRIWREYDPQRNKYLDFSQFSQFLKHINFDLKDKGPEKIFKDIVKKDNDRITFKEFISFYELLVTGEEFAEVFQKYSIDENKKYINIKGLIEFFDKEQNQILYPEDAINLICKFSNKARKKHESALAVIDSLIKKIKIKIRNNPKNNNDENLSNIMNILTNDLFNMRHGGQEVNIQPEITQSESMIKDYENHTLNKSKQLYDILYGNNILNNEYKEINEIKKQLKQTLQLSFRKFVNLLIDHTINSVVNKEKILRNQDMDHPLSDYFVNSSHNTYLEGNQIIGNSSIRMYPYVLDNGTRFVDLDTFDSGEEENEPVITHWHFPVGKISFKDTLIAIKNSAFQKNSYPVILSLENHCGDVCQEKMKNYFLSIIGRENLYILDSKTPPLLYPSPNELKNKFIIKNKRKRIFGDLAEMQSSYEKLYMSTIEQIRKKNENSLKMNNSSFAIEKNSNASNNNNNNIEKQKQIMNKYLRKDPQNNNKDGKEDKNFDIANDIIEEENSESISSESDVSDKADEKVENDSGEIVNKIRTNTYSFMKELPNNPNFISCNHFELNYHPESINLQSIIRKKTKRVTSKLKLTEAKYEIPRIIPLSNLALKKMREKISLNDEIDSFPPDISIVQLEEKDKILKKVQDIQNEDSKKNNKKIKIITIENLANILGMVGVKYHKETFDPSQFLPWECISVCENDIFKYISITSNKYKIMEYCKTSFLKIYPDGFRTDSSNQNVVQCWALGCQFCALNLQKTDDDCVLINKMFFKLNGGSKCGYVLKPRWLREFNEETFKKKALHPLYKIKFEILSGFHLHLTIPSGKKIKGMFVEVTLRSPNSFFERANEEKEQKLTTSIVNKNFLHPVFPTNCITFNIYEEELSFIFIKLFSENKDICLGRAVIPIVALNLGYRVVDLYDNTCSKLDEPFLIVKSNKIL